MRRKHGHQIASSIPPAILQLVYTRICTKPEMNRYESNSLTLTCSVSLCTRVMIVAVIFALLTDC
jgi:hypothetical protein